MIPSVAYLEPHCQQRARDYATRRRTEGKTDREIIRCLKRYIASPPSLPDCASLRATRTAARITLATAAAQLGTWDTRISRLERGLTHDGDLASRYEQWLSHQAAA